MPHDQDTDQSSHTSSAPPTTPLASQSPELWEPVPEWGEDEFIESIPDVLRAAALPSETPLETTTSAEELQERSSETVEEEKKWFIRVGDVIWSTVRHLFPIARIAIIVAMLGAVLYTYGLWQRGELANFARKVRSGQQPTLTLVETCEGRVLMWEVVGDRSEVLVQTSPQSGWVRVSRDDTTATNPALSPDAKAVVYLSLIDSGQIVVAPLDDTLDRTFVSITQLQGAATGKELPDTTFCEWTPLVWDADGRRLAFFGCRKEKPRSFVFVAQLDVDPVELQLIPDSDSDVAGTRQLQWSGADHIVISLPAPQSEQIKTIPVP